MTTTTSISSVYIASAWHADCDPFVTVAATEYGKAAEKLADLIESEHEYARINDLSVPDIRHSGIHCESVATLTSDDLEELQESGAIVLELA